MREREETVTGGEVQCTWSTRGRVSLTRPRAGGCGWSLSAPRALPGGAQPTAGGASRPDMASNRSVGSAQGRREWTDPPGGPILLVAVPPYSIWSTRPRVRRHVGIRYTVHVAPYVYLVCVDCGVRVTWLVTLSSVCGCGELRKTRAMTRGRKE